jgi:DNA adenine methylase
VPIVEELVKANIPPPRLFLEPFCGGASTALRLAGTGVVEHIVLADADDLVAAFWYTAAFDTSWLINRMMEEEVTVDRWRWWRAADPRGRRDKALKCLFLNRTTFSGILHGRAGPIGGKDQRSEYTIDCRFNKQTLAYRIRAVGELADAGRLLDVWNLDWRESLSRLADYDDLLTRDEIVVYLDPPYVEKAPFLYQWSFEDTEHNALASALGESTPYRWLLSYDDSDLARSLYPSKSDQHVLCAPQRYTAAGLKAVKNVKRQRIVRDELLVTTFPNIPDSTRYQTISSGTNSL